MSRITSGTIMLFTKTEKNKKPNSVGTNHRGNTYHAINVQTKRKEKDHLVLPEYEKV